MQNARALPVCCTSEPTPSGWPPVSFRTSIPFALCTFLLWGCARPGAVREELSPDQWRSRVDEATVTLLPPRCAGVVVHDGRYVITAAHCVEGARPRVAFRLYDGRQVVGTVVATEPAWDRAVVRLDAPACVRPLSLADDLPGPDTALLFRGRRDLRRAAQDVNVVKVGTCSTLPSLHHALFTTVRGRRGESGSPIVDRDLRVVGLLRSGARCSIATPTAGLGRLIDYLEAAVRPDPEQDGKEEDEGRRIPACAPR